MITFIIDLFTNAGVEYKVAILELFIDGLIVSAIWQVLSHFAGKKQERHLERKLDELYNKLTETKEEAERAKDEASS